MPIPDSTVLTTRTAVFNRETEAGPASSSGGQVTPPAELLAEASKRLGWAALIYACAYTLAYLGPHVTAWLTVPDYSFARIQNVFAVVSVGVALAVFVLARRAALAPERLLDVGLVFQVVGSLGISVAEFWNGFPPVTGRYTGVPWECVWILLYPMLAPNTPQKILWASLASASTSPATILLTAALGTDIGRSPVLVAVFFLCTTYLCAAMAYVIARVVYRYGVRLRKAQEFGSYELVTQLGEGGMGEVWVARHRMLARPAAVKLIRPDLLGHDVRSRETAVRRFEREARATAALRSTHTIDVFDFGVAEDGSFYYVMEFLEGLTLEAMVKRFGPIGPARAIYLLQQVCHSLGEAHARGLVHRDIKPANIFSSRLGPDCDFVKVLDFGLVKQTTDLTNATAVTGRDITTGTPAYMAPEIALARHDIDGRADIYAVGCVAYWLVTGQLVFVRDTPLATALAHVRDRPDPPAARTEVPIPAALNALILQCLAKDPADRPQTTGDLSRALGAIAVDPWTVEDARRWWALHGPLGTLSTVTAEDKTPAGVVYAKRSS
jgi:tRNA A-37 threonylcarbamoyl transferase component Bud32